MHSFAFMKARPAFLMLPCVTLTPLAGALGAVADERFYRGFSAWMSLCRIGRPGPLEALLLQARLMPLALGSMLAFALLGTLAVGSQKARGNGARVMLAAHAGCVLAVVVGALLCPLLFGELDSTWLALGGMALLETVITSAVALVLLRPLLRADPGQGLGADAATAPALKPPACCPPSS
jgi:hypothetical protein